MPSLIALKDLNAVDYDQDIELADDPHVSQEGAKETYTDAITKTKEGLRDSMISPRTIDYFKEIDAEILVVEEEEEEACCTVSFKMHVTG